MLSPPMGLNGIFQHNFGLSYKKMAGVNSRHAKKRRPSQVTLPRSIQSLNLL